MLYVLDTPGCSDPFIASRNRERRQAIRIAASQGWYCYHCWLQMTLEDLTRDHLIAKANGGRGKIDNIVAACVGCNKNKADGVAPSAGYLLMRRRQVLRESGIYAARPFGMTRLQQPGFGTDLCGKRIWAPQYGIT